MNISTPASWVSGWMMSYFHLSLGVRKTHCTLCPCCMMLCNQQVVVCGQIDHEPLWLRRSAWGGIGQSNASVRLGCRQTFLPASQSTKAAPWPSEDGEFVCTETRWSLQMLRLYFIWVACLTCVSGRWLPDGLGCPCDYRGSGVPGETRSPYLKIWQPPEGSFSFFKNKGSTNE